MNRNDFKNARSLARKSKRSFQLVHNGRHYSVNSSGCDRLDSDGRLFERVPAALLAMTLNSAIDSRRRLKLPRARRGLLSMARDLRTGK